MFIARLLAGKRRGLRFDPELLYAGAMFHDMGLDSDGRPGTVSFTLKENASSWLVRRCSSGGIFSCRSFGDGLRFRR
jgi:HD superfamily phosphodiesterase